MAEDTALSGDGTSTGGEDNTGTKAFIKKTLRLARVVSTGVTKGIGDAGILVALLLGLVTDYAENVGVF